IANPELQGVMKQAAENLQNIKAPAAPMSLKEALEIINSEARKLQNRHMELYNTYHEHKKALKALIDTEPEKPLLLGMKKWKQEHDRWSAEKDALTKTLMEDLTALGCVMDYTKNAKNPVRAEAEVKRRHKSNREDTFREAAALHPEAMNVIRADAARKKEEERKTREIKEAAERREKERREALYGEAKKLMRQAGMSGKWTFVFDAQTDGRGYSGEIIGIVPWEGKFVAVQKLSDEMAVLHRLKAMPEALAVGARLTIAHDPDKGIFIAPEREKSREMYRGR
ncbi:MAG: hypothetical protein LBB62_09710, partial [Proteiniphilum sp.]|nr:hypothetical protein [Proteiniphilum sp.]